MKIFNMFMTVCALSLLVGTPVWAATTDVAPGAGTLQTRIDAAASGDVLELSTGDYSGECTIPAGKNLTIRAKASNTPKFTLSSVSSLDANIGMSINANLNWEGIDVTVGVGLEMVMKVAAAPADITVNFKNCALKTDPNFPYVESATNYGGLTTVTTFLWVESGTISFDHCSVITDTGNCRLGITGWVGGTGATINANDTTFDFLMNRQERYGVLLQNGGGGPHVMTLNRCTLISRGANYFWGAGGAVAHKSIITLNDCTVDMSQVAAAGWFYTRQSTQIDLNRCRVKCSGTGHLDGRDLPSAATDVSTWNITNCIIEYDSGSGVAGYPVDSIGGVNMAIKHCTFVDKAAQPAAQSVIRFGDVDGGANQYAGQPASLTVQNCVFSGPGPVNAYIDDKSNLGSSNSAVTWTIGTNLVQIDPATNAAPEREKITLGTVLIGDPKLTSDGHLDNASPAMNKGPNVGVTDDIDKETRPRPTGSQADLGADEVDVVPVELSTFTAE